MIQASPVNRPSPNGGLKQRNCSSRCKEVIPPLPGRQAAAIPICAMEMDFLRGPARETEPIPTGQGSERMRCQGDLAPLLRTEAPVAQEVMAQVPLLRRSAPGTLKPPIFE